MVIVAFLVLVTGLLLLYAGFKDASPTAIIKSALGG